MSDWSELTLGDALRIKHGFAFPGAGFGVDPSAPQVLTPGNFALSGGFQPAKPKSYVGEYPPEFLLSSGEVVVTMTDLSKAGDTLGYAAQLPHGKQFLHNQRIGLVEVFDRTRLDERFFHYLTRTVGYRSYILGTASGSTVKHTSPGRIGDYRTTVPPVDEQQAIAGVLGALDDKIAADTALAERAEELASSTYDSLVATWKHVPMSTLLKPILGGTPPRARDDYWSDGDQLWVSARDITSAPSRVVLDTAEKITVGAVASTKAKPLPAGSVILTARGTVGEVGRLARPASFNQSCYGFRPDALPPGLLYFSILRATERAKAVAHGSVFDTITKATFHHLDLAWNESQAASAEGAVAPILDVVSAAVRENRTLAAARDTLLPQLMSGKLRVRDAEAAVSAVGV